MPFGPNPPKPDARTTPMRDWLRALQRVSSLDEAPTLTFPALIELLGERYGPRPALLSDSETLTFEDLSRRANRYSRWALAHDVGPGTTVCLFMPNRPDYLAAWLGITRAGGVVALLNTSLAGPALAHCVSVVRPAHVILAAELGAAFASAEPLLSVGPQVWLLGPTTGDGPPASRPLDLELDCLDGAPLTAAERPPVTLDDRALYIYTSGTTGLPKAAVVSHRRIMTWSNWFAGLADTSETDRMYNCLPLYHSVGGIVATGCVLVTGGSVVIAGRFSATAFWDEVVRWECTLFQYIGELCRYLANAPRSPRETSHKLRICLGNGLRADVWPAFQRRFAIPRVLEFYAATEGNFSLFNVEGKVGAIGRIPPFLAHRFPAAIIQFDAERGIPRRDARGFCIRCDRDEPGEAIGLIGDGTSRPAGAFEGYTSPEESEKKVLRNVFGDGDAWFRTGDLMRIDRQGFFYFVDRVGDTFRWKGENVATAEVAQAIMACPGVIDATVYGVAVPNAEGRAGMAALVADSSFSPAGLYGLLERRLPPYARPLFLRLCVSIEATETFKQKTRALADEGFDPARIADPLYVGDPGLGTYRPLDEASHAQIVAGVARL